MKNSFLKKFSLPVFEDEEKTRQARIVYALTLVMGIGFTPLILFSLFVAKDSKSLPVIIATVLAWFSFWLVTRGNIIVPSYILPSMMLPSIAYVVYLGLGLHDENTPGFLIVIALAGLLLGKRGIIIFAILSSITLILFGLGEMSGLIVNKASHLTDAQAIFKQVVGPSGFAAIMYVLIDTLTKTAERAKKSEGNLRLANQELEKLTGTLENRVADRTRDLEIASDVSRQISQVLNLDELLPRLVEKTKEGFGLYFSSVYLYEEKTQQLILAAGTGEAGRQMKAENKAYFLSDVPSLIAQAGRDRHPIVVDDVRQSETYFPTPYLPDTCSEISVPMIVNDDLIGVLGLQSTQLNHFGEDEIRILTTLAEQIGVAILNARLYEEQVHVAEQLRTVDKVKSQFLASMSHELRTPLNAIINFVEMVAIGMVGTVNDEQKELLEQSLQSSNHLLHLINDVLDISKIQAGQLSLFIEQNVNLYEEMNTVMGMIQPLLKEKSLQLVQDIDSNLPTISGDKRRIRQILLNLLSNAIKFTEKGTITLSTKRQKDSILFAIIDTGPGIPTESQSLIFEPFIQTEDGIKHAQGTGLGLPISRSLAEAHGGRLWLESQVGEGSSFFFTLPV